MKRSLLFLLFILNNLVTFSQDCESIFAPYETNFQEFSFNFSTANWFESGNCWRAYSDENFDWRLNRGASFRDDTGPSAARDGNTSSNYMLFDNSLSSLNDGAFLEGPELNLSLIENAKLSFYYHMYGDTMGTLSVEIDNLDGNGFSEVFSLEGQQQFFQTSPWFKATIDLSSYSGAIKFRFKATEGFFIRSMMGVDEVAVSGDFLCLPPVDFSVDNITSSSVDLFWDTITDESISETLEYVLIDDNTIPDATTQASGIINPEDETEATRGGKTFSIQDISAGTDYALYMRTVCNDNKKSEWTEAVNFSSENCPESFEAPYQTNFESFEATTDLIGDNCWFSPEEGTFNWSVANQSLTSTLAPNAAFDGNQFLYVESSQSGLGKEAIVQTPTIDLSQLGSAQLNFYTYMFGEDVESIRIEVDDRFGSGFVEVESILDVQQDQNDAWTLQTIDLSNFSSTVDIRFVVSMSNTSPWFVAIDLVDINGCLSPTDIKVDQITQETAEISWEASSTEVGGYDWIVMPKSFLSPDEDAAVAKGSVGAGETNASIEGLSPFQDYNVYLRTGCQDGPGSWSEPESFFTEACNQVIEAPYFNGFENFPLNTLWSTIECWTNKTNDFQTRWYARERNTASSTGPSEPYEGNQFLVAGGSSGDEMSMTSPLIDISKLENPQLSFYYHMFGDSDFFGSYVGTLIVQVDNLSGNGFEEVFRIQGEQQPSKESPWRQEIIDLSSYSDTLKVRFLAKADGAFNAVAIDAFNVNDASFNLAPTDVFINEITTSSARLNWTSEASEAEGFEWIVMHKGEDLDLSNSIASGKETSESKEAELTGLSTQTSYDVYIRTKLNSGKTSAWSIPLTFTTACDPVEAPYNFSFDTFQENRDLTSMACWSSSGNSGYIWSSTSVGIPLRNAGPDHPHLGTYYIFANSLVGNDGDLAYIDSPIIDISNLDTPQLSFFYHMYRRFSGDMGTLRVKINNFDGDGFIETFSISGRQQDNSDDPWIEQIIDLSAYSDLVQVRFEAERGSNNDTDIAIDAFSIDDVSACEKPTNLNITKVTDQSATLTWDEVSPEIEGYEWVLMEGNNQPDLPSSVASGQVGKDITSIDIEDLEASKAYKAYVRTNCSRELGDSTWSFDVRFETDCPPESFPYFENFESGELDKCWSSEVDYFRPIDGAFVTDQCSDESDGKYLYISYTDIVVETNRIDVSEQEAVVVEFDIMNGCVDFSEREKGIVIDYWNGEEWINIEEFEGTDIDPIWTSFAYTLNTGLTRDFKLRFVRNNDRFPRLDRDDISIDNLKVGFAPTCLPPPSSSFEISQSQPGSTSISWDEAVTSSQSFEWIVMPKGFDPNPISAIDGGITKAGETFTEATELEGNTDYLLFIRSNCGPDGLSNWSNVFEFTTAPSCGQTFIDSGGLNNVPIREDSTVSIWPDNENDVVGVDFLSLDIGQSTLEVFDGPDETSPSLGLFTNRDDMGSFTSSHPTGSLTFVYTYQQSTFVVDGWEAEVNCCEGPKNLAADQVTSNAVHLSWQESNTADIYEWIIMKNDDSPNRETAVDSGLLDSDQNSVEISSLIENQNYVAYMRSICAGEANNWSAPVDFETISSVPFEEEFTSSDLSSLGWDTSGWSVSSEPQQSLSGRNDTPVVFKKFDGSNGETEAQLTLPEVHITSSANYLSFEFKSLRGLDDTRPVDPGSFEFSVNITDSSGESTVYKYINDGKQGWHKVYLELEDFVEDVIITKINVKRNSGNFYLLFDQFSLNTIEGFVFFNKDWLPNPPQDLLNITGTVEIIEGSAILQSVNAKHLSVFADAKLDIEGVVNLDGELFTDGEVTFKSDNTKTAQLGSVESINGVINVERYIPSKRAFRLVSSSVSGQSIAETWQQDTHITGEGGESNGFDATQSNNPSMFTFDNTLVDQSGRAGWTAVTSTLEVISAGTPYRLFVRGDRSIDLEDNESPSKPTILKASGDMQVGDFTPVLSSTPNNFSFVGNPYQAVVDYLGVNTSNLTDFIYVWDPFIAGENGNGGYVTVDITGLTLPSPSSSNASEFIEPGQAFFVQNTSAGNGSITFEEKNKFIFSDLQPLPPLQPESTTSEMFYINSRLYKTQDFQNGSLEADAIGLRFNENYTTKGSDEDASKLGNPGENFAVVNNGFRAIDKQNLPKSGHEIQLAILNYQDSDYSLSFDVGNPIDGLDVYLIDSYLESTTQLTSGVVYNFTVDASIGESVDAERFKLQFEQSTLSEDAFEMANISLYPNPVQEVLNIVIPVSVNLDSVKIYNMLGKAVKSTQSQTVNMSGLASGVYLLELTTSEGKFIKKVIKE